MKDSQAGGAMSGRDSDEIFVRNLYERLMDGWNQGRADEFAAPFSPNGVLVGFDGTMFQGREEIVLFHQPLFEKWLKGTRLVGEVTRVQFAAPEVAIMHAVGGTIMRGESRPDRSRDSIQTLVAVRENGEWAIAAFQNTRRRPMSLSFSSILLWKFTDWLWRLLLPRN